MVSQRPPLWRFMRERSNCRATLWRSCLRLDIEGQLPAMWPLPVNSSHMGQRMVGLCERWRVLRTPLMNSCLCVNWIFVKDSCFWCKVKSAPFVGARERRAPCLEVCERGVCLCLVMCVCVCISFQVGVHVSCRLA
jgi:hypothetical protein